MILADASRATYDAAEATTPGNLHAPSAKRDRLTLLVNENCSAVDPIFSQIDQSRVGIVEGVGSRRDLDPDPGGDFEERPPVGPRVCCHAAESPFFEEMTVVIQRRNVAQIDPGDGKGAPTVKSFQGGRHKGAHRREQDRRIQWFWWHVGRVPGAARPYVECEPLGGRRSGHDVQAGPFGEGDLGGQVG